MFSRIARLAVIVSLALLPVLIAPADAGVSGITSVALHAQTRSAQGICDPPSAGGTAPYDVRIPLYNTSGEVGAGYNVYLIGVSASGMAGVSCGIDYDPVAASGVDVLDWVLCGDLQFTNAGPNGEWPAAGGGNRITFDYTVNCPAYTVPGYESDGVFSIFGAFYVYAYGDDQFRVTQNMNLESGPELVLGTCDGAEVPLPTDRGGWVAFSADGTSQGCNPALGPCDEFSPPPLCSVQPSSLDFGDVAVGEYVDRSFVLANTGGGVLAGTVSPGCDDFLVIANSGPYAIGENQTRQIIVRFAPQTEGPHGCSLDLGNTGCGAVVCAGNAVPGAPAVCSLSPSPLYFGTVPVGDFADLDFTITNEGVSPLEGVVAAGCGAFTVTNGAGAYSLGSGQSHPVTVRFAPQTEGPQECALDLGGSACAALSCRGTGGTLPDCLLEPETLDFVNVTLGTFKQRSFTVTNTTGTAYDVTIGEACDAFTIMSGGGTVTLQPDTPHEVVVRFYPQIPADYSCTIEISGACNDMPASGHGSFDYVGGSGTNSNAVVTLHAIPHGTPGTDVCAADSVFASTECSDYDMRADVRTATDVYLVVALGNPYVGVGGVSCGILYNHGDIGGRTRTDGTCVDVHSWTQCSSGLMWLSSPTGLPEDEWPASGGGLRLTWDIPADCQTTEVGWSDGVHAVAGAFYVYAYDEDIFQVIANNNVGIPEFQVGDCNAALSDLSLSQAGALSFGTTYGYNPCPASPVPVELLSFTAERSSGGALVAWKTGGTTSDHLGFEVHRGTEAGGRVLISDGLLSGRTDYTFVDPDPPAGETEYWLAERTRTGTVEWHGPAVLSAAAIGGKLAMTQPPNNPFVTSTQLSFRLPENGEVNLRIFDMAGREVAHPFSGFLAAGEQTVEWNGRDARGQRLSAGAYFYRIETAQGMLSGKVIRLH